jgi:hypothetical protein
MDDGVLERRTGVALFSSFGSSLPWSASGVESKDFALRRGFDVRDSPDGHRDCPTAGSRSRGWRRSFGRRLGGGLLDLYGLPRGLFALEVGRSAFFLLRFIVLSSHNSLYFLR